jgi:hypothetical protein
MSIMFNFACNHFILSDLGDIFVGGILIGAINKASHQISQACVGCMWYKSYSKAGGTHK